MDPVTLIVTAMETGAALEGTDAASPAVRAAYVGFVTLVMERLPDKRGAELALARRKDDPEAWRAKLRRELDQAGASHYSALTAASRAFLDLTDEEGKRAVDARGAQGVQVGDGNTQVTVYGNAAITIPAQSSPSPRSGGEADSQAWIESGPYTLMTSPGGLVGRTEVSGELSRFLWDSGSEARIFVLRAIGGMGKSATIWHYLHSNLPPAIRFDAIIWWSFSDVGGSVAGLLDELSEFETRESRTAQGGEQGADVLQAALQALRSRRLLVVLDGLERQLNSYTHMPTREALDAERASVADPGVNERRMGDPRLGLLLSTVLSSDRSKVIATSRLMPADLEVVSGRARYGVRLVELPPLSASESRQFLENFGIPDDLLLLEEVKRITGAHPLLLQVVAQGLAGSRLDAADLIAKVARAGIPVHVLDQLERTRAVVLGTVIDGLSGDERTIAKIVAAAITPLSADLISATAARLSMTPGSSHGASSTPGENVGVSGVKDISCILAELADLALIARHSDPVLGSQWSMHPLVSAAIRASQASVDAYSVAEAMAQEFSIRARGVVRAKVTSAADLADPIALFHAICDGHRLDDAGAYYLSTLHYPLTYQCRDHQERLNMLARLFPGGWQSTPPLTNPTIRIGILNSAGITLQWIGQNRVAASLIRQAVATSEGRSDPALWSNLAAILLYTDDVEGACSAAVSAIHCRAGYDSLVVMLILYLAIVLGQAGYTVDSLVRLAGRAEVGTAPPGWKELRLGDLALWGSNPGVALAHGNRALAYARDDSYSPPLIEASRLVGQSLVELGRASEAVPHLEHALRQAQGFVLVQEELPARVALARALIDDDVNRSRLLIEDGFDGRAPAEYRWFRVDALTVLHDVYAKLGQADRANKYHREALRIAYSPPGWEYAPGLRRLGVHVEQKALPQSIIDLIADLEGPGS